MLNMEKAFEYLRLKNILFLSCLFSARINIIYKNYNIMKLDFKLIKKN